MIALAPSGSILIRFHQVLEDGIEIEHILRLSLQVNIYRFRSNYRPPLISLHLHEQTAQETPP